MRLLTLTTADLYRERRSYAASFTTDEGEPYSLWLQGEHGPLFEYRSAELPPECTPVITASDIEAELFRRLDDFLDRPAEPSEALSRLQELRDCAAARAPYFARASEGVEAAETALRKAMLTSDVAALDRLIDEALIFTALDGTVVGKAEDLAMHRSGRFKIEKLEPSDLRLSMHGDVAVVSVKTEAAAIIDGQRHENTLRYTRFWAYRSGAWRIIGGHMSDLTAPQR